MDKDLLAGIDPAWLTDTLHELVEVDSTVGYYPEIHAWLEEFLAPMGYEVTYDNKATAYVRVPGEDHEKTVCVGAHLDTISYRPRVQRRRHAEGAPAGRRELP